MICLAMKGFAILMRYYPTGDVLLVKCCFGPALATTEARSALMVDFVVSRGFLKKGRQRPPFSEFPAQGPWISGGF